jgi:hypothetical protein
MISELETLFKRLDEMRMTPAERNLAKARLMQADAIANGLHAAFRNLARLIPGRSAPAPRSLGLHAQAPNSRA